MSGDPPELGADLADAHHLTVDVDAVVDELLVDMAAVDEVEADIDAAHELGVDAAPSQGLPGPPGPSGTQGDRGAPGRDGAPGGALTRTTAAPLAGGRVVVSVGADRVRAASAMDADDGELILGVCMASAPGAGVDVDVVRLGLVRDSAWSWAVGEPVFCGAAGELTQAPGVGLAYWARVGVAVEAGAVFVSLLPPLYLD